MSNPAGSFIWYELMANDADAAGRFYAAVIGWSVAPAQPGAPIDYRHIGRSDGGSAGGILQLSPEMREGGARTCWLPYLSVTDVDRKVAAIQDDGGRLLMPKMTLDVGDIALVADPGGVPFYVMRPVPPADNPHAASDVFSVSEPQHLRWNELAAPDLAVARAFYAEHFGFAFERSMPMGEMGDYCFIEHGGMTVGAMMQQQPEQPALWLPYIGVTSAKAARLAIEEHGGTVLRGPHEVPGGEWIVVALDPQGAVFGVVGPEGE